jgi:DNA-binding transcriptional LysR family regulator
MLRDLQISRLRALVTVVDLGGFRRAGEALHVSQPAISQQIRQLSTMVKAPIFLSTGRDLQLSPEGEELLGYARRIVDLNDEVVGRFVPSGEQSRIAIGVGEQLADALPRILRLLTDSLPGARISIRTGLSEVMAAQVAGGRLDMAVLMQSTVPRADSVATHRLGMMAMDWFGQPARTGAEVPLTLFTEPCGLRGCIMDALTTCDVPWRVAYEGAELVGLRAAAQVGLGVTCLIANGDELWGLPRASVCLPPPPGPLPVTLALAPARTDRSATMERVVKRALKDALSAYPMAA